MSRTVTDFKSFLQRADILIPDNDVRGSVTYLDYGLKIRARMFDIAKDLLRDSEFMEVKFSDLLKRDELKKLDAVTPISSNYFAVEGSDFVMTAGHEASAYLFIKKYQKLSPVRPIKFFHFGGVYRFPKNSKFPFNLGERRSFLECYIAFSDPTEAEEHLQWAEGWNRDVIKNTLHLPCVEVNRPLFTNKPLSRKTVCIDTINPLGFTVITGMTYFHDDLFTKAFGVFSKGVSDGRNLMRTVHFGMSDNLFFSYLLNAFDNGMFKLLTSIAPYHVALYVDDVAGVSSVVEYLKKEKIRYRIHQLSGESYSSLIKRSAMMGIPVSVVAHAEAMDLYYRDQKLAELFSHERIRSLLERNDEEIIELFRKRQEDMVVQCVNVSDINLALEEGKVAFVYLKENDERVRELESRIISGEVLGFAAATQLGPDTLSGDTVSTVAYISKRA